MKIQNSWVVMVESRYVRIVEVEEQYFFIETYSMHDNYIGLKPIKKELAHELIGH